MAERFEDERGVIQDLVIAGIDGVTEIFSRAGAVRGNHVHRHTTQWTYVVSGRLLVRRYLDGDIEEQAFLPREMAVDLPGVPHAWRAIEDTVVLVFSAGPRTGEDYESDTTRLETPLL